ncbi:helix-turn-helix domain-containing protein [Paenibacillus sp. strain BS8-2]
MGTNDDGTMFPEQLYRITAPLLSLAAELPLNERLLQLCHLLVDHTQLEQPDAHSHLSQAYFHELLHYANTAIPHAEDGLLTSLELSRRYIQNEYAERITIATLAGSIRISPKYYMELFSKHYGIGAIQYLNQIRIEAAKRLLMRGGRRLREIALACGFQDEFYFSRRFKQETGVSPSHFIHNRSRVIVVLDSAFLGFLAPLHFLPYAAPSHPIWRSYYDELIGNELMLRLSIGRSPSIIHNNVHTLLREGRQYDIIFYPADQLHQDVQLLESAGTLVSIDLAHAQWQIPFLQIASLLHAESEAARFIAAYEYEVLAASMKLSRWRETHSIQLLLIEGTYIYNYASHTASSVLFEDLGFRAAHSHVNDIDTPFSLSELIEAQPDILFVLIYQDEESMYTWESLQFHEDWLELPAIRQRQLYMLQHFPWREDSPLARKLIVDATVRMLSDNPPSY